MTNPILEVIYRDRDEHAKKFNYDIDAILDDCERTAIELGCTLVSHKDLKKRDAKPKKVLAKQHARPAKAKKRTKTTKH